MNRRSAARFRFRPSLRAVLLIAVIAVGQFALLDSLAATERNTAHVIDISGAQRMRSQRIAFLVTTMHDRGPTPSTRAELDAAIDATLAARREILLHANDYGGLQAFDGQFALGDRIRVYLGAARAFARDPSDESAFRTILARRVDLLDHLNDAVRWRAAKSQETYDRLVLALMASLGVTLVTLVVSWLRIVLPNEIALEKTLKKVIERNEERVSLLDENPNAVGFFDRAGFIVQGNHASLQLLGRSESIVGQHLSQIVHRRALAVAMEAFRDALQGVPRTYETVLLDAHGREVDVEATAFPNVVNGSVVGVIVLAKDIREIKVMEKRVREHSHRITELYRIAATRGRSYEDQLSEALALVAARLGFDWAILNEVSDNVMTPFSIFGNPSGVARGHGIPLERTFGRYVVDSGTIWSVEDLRRSPFAPETAPEKSSFLSTGGKPLVVEHHAARWGAVTIAPVRIGDRIFGTLSVGSQTARATPLAAEDGEFLLAVSGLLGLIIERRQQERRLDALAYFDALTGLANRVSFTDRLGETTAAAARHGKEYAVFYLDLDRFKSINDVFGHATGDEVLRVAARRMQGCVRADDTVARLGGDEFSILVPTPYGRAGAEDLAQRLLAAIKRPFVIDGVAHLIGVSIGIALYPTNGTHGVELLKAADEALYRAKRAGRNQMAFAA